MTESDEAKGLEKRRFSRERLLQQYREGKLVPHEEIDFGDPVGDELGGPDDPTRFDKWE
jgi:antitoxin MazE